jgi:hypothetical protein
MSPDDQAAAAAVSLVDSLKTYIDDVPEDERADALHGVGEPVAAHPALLRKPVQAR